MSCLRYREGETCEEEVHASGAAIGMKRIWFVQQKPFDYMPLQAGLGYIASSMLQEYDYEVHQKHPPYFVPKLCPKIYTTRTRRMKGEYYVVEGSRFKAKPVEPRIEFKVEKSFEVNLSLESLYSGCTWIHHTLLQQETTVPLIQRIQDVFNMPSDYSFPELDLGYKGATFEDLKNELLKLNPKATLDTPFFMNRLESIREESQ